MDIYNTNAKAWDLEVSKGNYWTKIVDESTIQMAKLGKPKIWVTPFKNVPLSWIENLKDKNVLLACGGGGQQTVILSAFGCNVTTIDISEKQIEQDRIALEKYGLKANTIVGNLLDLPFEDDSFDAVIIPQALNFIDNLELSYNNVNRVLKNNGLFIFGILNPAVYMFDDKIQHKKLSVKYTLPFSDLKSLSKKELNKRIKNGDTIEFSHTLQTIIGSLIDSNFIITGYYSDESGSSLTDSFIYDSHLAFRAVKSDLFSV